MDLIPKPDQVVSAASNVARRVLRGGVADLRPMPRSLIDEGALREVYHYRPDAAAPEQGDPVLLVAPLAAPALCFDLRRGCSLVEHLVGSGRPTYLVEYGEVRLSDRSVDLLPWVTDVVPAAIRAASTHAGDRPVHVVGWSLGGIFALLAAAADTDLPIASITVAAAPVDVSLVPLVAPLRPLLDPTAGGGLITRGLLAAVPRPLVDRTVGLGAFQRLVAKPIVQATHLDDTELLAQLEAVDRFTARMSAYPGRSFGQLYHRFVTGNALVDGTLDLGERTLALADITPPVLVVGGATDGIAPVPAVRAVVPLLENAAEVRFEIVPGGHLGLLTGRAARASTWPVLDEWIEQWSTGTHPAPEPDDEPPAIGTGRRRHGSAASRSLG